MTGAPGRHTTRDAAASDAAALSALARQLGYDAAPREIVSRLERMDTRVERVIVAVDGDGAVVAWTSVRATEHIHSGRYAEISGFVVDEACRGRGVGRFLMAAVERWAREEGLAVLRLSANVTRTRAHSFYESLGFARTKQQFAYRKELGAPNTGR